jgi:hypothetical protein
MDLIFGADYKQTNAVDESTSRAEIPFIVLANGDPNAEDEAQVRGLLETPGTGLAGDYNDLPLSEYDLVYVGGSNWTGVAKYGAVPPLVLGQTVWEFDATGSSVKFLQSKETVSRTAINASGTIVNAPDFKGVIGASDDNIEGCDVIVPQALFTARKRWKMTDLPNPAYLQQCYSFVGSTNSDVFSFTWLGATFTFQIGELLLQGFSCVEAGLDTFECSYKFAASPNRLGTNGIVIQGLPNPIDKRGFEYLWVYYRRTMSNNVHVRVPQAVYVERVYDRNLFDLLEIN